MGRTRATSERQLRDQLERMIHRSATVSQLVTGAAAPLDAQGRLVLRLVAGHGPVRSSELAERTRLSRPSVSRCITALEQAGLVRAEPDPGDGRAALVGITPAGTRQLEAISQASHARIRQVTADFRADEIETLARLLARLNDNADDITVATPRYRWETASS